MLTTHARPTFTQGRRATFSRAKGQRSVLLRCESEENVSAQVRACVGCECVRTVSGFTTQGLRSTSQAHDTAPKYATGSHEKTGLHR